MRSLTMPKLTRGLVTALLCGLTACGSGARDTASAGNAKDRAQAQAGVLEEGLTSENGLTTNGLTTNGLTTNGLTTNGLSAVVFGAWFAGNPTSNATIMKYLVKCGLPAGMSLGYWFGPTYYSWPGELGLAPTWVSYGYLPLAEQQLVSACMAAHTNKYGVHVTVSVRGYLPDGSAIPLSAGESSAYNQDEGCYFGNLFDGSGVFSAYSSNSPLTSVGETSLRACAVSDGKKGSCAPMVSTGKTCQQICTGYTSAVTGAFTFTSCNWNGVNYKPLSVRLSPNDINSCGDGVCDDSETCFNPTTGVGCQADCGKCF